jgi:1-acyl-sn-glycerol-3-phosphate acyltransferase
MKHQSMYETLKIFHLFGDVRILLKKELTWLPLWGWYTQKLGMISVDRGKGKTAIQSILKNAKPIVEDGVPILIYPQGTRVSIHDTIETRPYKQGAIRLYEHFDIPIVPVAMNAGQFWPKRSFLIQSGVVTFKILPTIAPGQNLDEVLKTLQGTIEKESQKLLR